VIEEDEEETATTNEEFFVKTFAATVDRNGSGCCVRVDDVCG
jgi:hypothetical protein